MDEDFFGTIIILAPFPVLPPISLTAQAHYTSPSRPKDLLAFPTPLLRSRTLKVRTLSLFQKNLRYFEIRQNKGGVIYQ